jgi:hypothetical protein
MALGLLGLIGAWSARADVAFEVSTGVGHSDNITRVDAGEIDETLASAGLRLDWEETTRRLTGDAQANLSYVEYLDNTYDGELLGQATAHLDLGIVPERFHWRLDESFGQARTDPFQPVTPDNRENVNHLSTGPELRLRFGAVMNARLFAGYSSTDYEESPLDAERTSVGLSIGRESSSRSNVALNLLADESRFDSDALRPFERRSVFASYELGTGGRTSMNAELGYSWLEMDGEDAEGGLLVDLSVTRELTRSSTLTVSAGRNFSDAGEALDAGPAGHGTTEINATADPFENTDVSIEWLFSRHRTSFGIGAGYDERRYQTQSQFDSKTMAYQVNFGRQLRPALRFGLLAMLTAEEFRTNDQESDDWRTEATLDWRFGRHLGLQFRVERSQRSSSSGTAEYTENRAYLGFTFSGDRAPPTGP